MAYTIYEQPQPPDDTPPGLDKPILENTSNREKVWYARGYVRCMNTDTKEGKVYYANNISDGSSVLAYTVST